jgi:hypothetical protein
LPANLDGKVSVSEKTQKADLTLKVGENAYSPMYKSRYEQKGACFPVNAELNLYPSQAGRKLKQQQYKIDDPQN